MKGANRLRIERDLAKERTQVERLTRDLAQVLDENRKLKELVTSYEGATVKERELYTKVTEI